MWLDLVHALVRTIGIAMRHLDTPLTENALEKPVDGCLMTLRAIRRATAVKYVIRPLFDTDNARAARKNLPRCFRQRSEKLCLGGIEVAFQRRDLKAANQGE